MNKAMTNAKPGTPANSKAESNEQERWRQWGRGFVVGVLAWAVAKDFGLEVLPLIGGWAADPLSYWVAGLVGAVLNGSRIKALLWSSSGLLCLVLLCIISSSWIMQAARTLVRTDQLQHADAVYVLGGGIHQDGTPDDFFQQRVSHGYELLGQHYAPVLVVPRLSIPRMGTGVWPYKPAVSRQMHDLGLPQPVLDIGPVANTFDEAKDVAQLARQKGWKRVILVSSPTHMRRVAAVFGKAFQSTGATIICSPCVEGTFDLGSTGDVLDRLGAFRTWIHETIGYRVYKLRGRI